MKRHWRTTTAGYLAAACAALTTLGDLAPPWTWIVKGLGVVGLALLGHAAADRHVSDNGASVPIKKERERP